MTDTSKEKLARVAMHSLLAAVMAAGAIWLNFAQEQLSNITKK